MPSETPPPRPLKVGLLRPRSFQGLECRPMSQDKQSGSARSNALSGRQLYSTHRSQSSTASSLRTIWSSSLAAWTASPSRSLGLNKSRNKWLQMPIELTNRRKSRLMKSICHRKVQCLWMRRKKYSAAARNSHLSVNLRPRKLLEGQKRLPVNLPHNWSKTIKSNPTRQMRCESHLWFKILKDSNSAFIL